MGEMFAEANRDVDWYDPDGHGYTLVTLTADTVTSDFYKVSGIREKTYTMDRVATFVSARDGEGMSALAKG